MDIIKGITRLANESDKLPENANGLSDPA